LARKKKKKDAQQEEIGLPQIRKLWTVRPAREWLKMLQETAPDYKWSLQGEHSIKGCCPYHTENTPSFVLSFNRKQGKCFGSCGTYKDNLISIIAHIRGGSYAENLLFIQRNLGLNEDEFGQNVDKLAAHYRVQEMKKHAAVAFREIIRELIAEDPKELQYLKPGLVHLTKGRKLSADVLMASSDFPVGLYGKPEHVKKYIGEEFHELYDEYFNAKYRKAGHWGAVIFHYNDTPGSISRFKMRLLDKLAVEKTSDLDRATEEEARALVPKDHTLYVDDPYTNNVGILGLHKYQHLLGHQTDPNAYVTEGEFDVLSVMNAQVLENSYDFVLLGTAGTGSLDVGFLKEYGIRTVWLIPDHPAKQGDGYVRNFLAEKGNYAPSGARVPFSIKVFQWPVSIFGFDLDDVIIRHGYDTVREAMVTNRNSTFLNSIIWIMTKCDNQIAQIKKDRDRELADLDPAEDTEVVAAHAANIRDNAFRAIHEVILEWFRFVQDPADQLTFSQKYATEENIDITKHNSVYSQVYALDTREGVKQKIKDSFKEHFSFAFYEMSSTRHNLYIWSKHNQELVYLPTSEIELGNILSQYLRQDYVTWLDKLLQGSPVWDFNEEDLMTVEKKKIKDGMMWITSSLRDCRGEATNVRALTTVGQGIHHFGLPMSVQSQGYIYVVNGNKVFRGCPNPETEMIEWEQLENCVDNNLLFRLDPKFQWSYIDEVSDLYAASQVDLKSTYEKICTILDGWRFDNHDTTVKYLAAQIMALPVAAAIGNVNIVYITGESESGKTSLLKGLLGGTRNRGHEVEPLLESAYFDSDTTMAGIYQTLDRSSITMLYDEAEVSDKHNTTHDKRTEEIQRITMALPQGGISITRGGQTASQRSEYFLRMPLIMAGINLPADKVFLSRVLVIYTRKEYGHRSLADYIYEQFSHDDLADLRRDITIALLPHIPYLLRRRKQYKQELTMLSEGRKVSDRFLDNILTSLVVYELVSGEDGKELFKAIYEKNRDRLESIHGSDDTSAVITSCLYNESVKITYEDGLNDFTSVRTLLQNEQYTQLNQKECGVYYYAPKDWIIIFWRQAKYSVLRYDRYGRYPEESLKEQVSKTKFVVPEVSQEDHESIKAALGIRELRSPHEYSVIKGDYLGVNDVLASGTGMYQTADEIMAAYEQGDSVPEFDPGPELYDEDKSNFSF